MSSKDFMPKLAGYVQKPATYQYYLKVTIKNTESLPIGQYAEKFTKAKKLIQLFTLLK